MSILGKCPVGAAIPDIPVSSCPESLGQVQKVVLQRLYSASGVKNKFPATTKDPKLKASWTPFLSAADGTKAVISPYINTPKTEPGAARTYGGGNETVGGIELIVGRNPTPFTGVLLNQPTKTVAAMKEYQVEEVGVYLIDENGNIGLLVDNVTTPTEYYPIPVYGLFVGDKSLGGLEAPDSNAIQWKFQPNWSDKLVIITPTDFNALTDLVKPAV
jgi:hypothetical protein